MEQGRLFALLMATGLLVSCSSGVSEGGGNNIAQANLVQTGVLGQISSGVAHTCVLTSRSEVACWGKGENGRLGNGDPSSVDREYAVMVVEGVGNTAPLKDIVQISSGKSHTCALNYEGKVVCWGEGTSGRLGNGDSSGVDREYPVAVVETAGSTTPLEDIVQISAGGGHTCALTSGGRVLCWGEGTSGELGDGSFLSKSAPIEVISTEGSAEPLTNIVQISAGDTHTCALTSRGSVVCWGNGANAQLGNDDPLKENKNYPVSVVAEDGANGFLQNIDQIDSGRNHSCAVTTLGRIVCWGEGANGQLGNDNIVADSTPVTVVSSGGETTPLEDVVQVSSGDFHTCARTSGESVLCWGKGSDGQLGNDDSADKDHPVAVVEEDGSVEPLSAIVQISSGGDYACALSSGGALSAGEVGLMADWVMAARMTRIIP